MKSMKGTFFLNKFSFLPPKTTLINTQITHHKFGISPFNIPETTDPNEKAKPFISNDKSHPMEVEENPFLSHFEPICPPGGADSIILYITSLRSIRKTFEECNTVLFLLQSFKVKFFVRDVLMDLGYREELWKILGGKVIPPKLFIRGRFIGGSDEVVSLNEQGKLKNLLQGIPQNVLSNNGGCVCCSNQRFLVCSTCHGCRKIFPGEGSNGNLLQDQVVCVRCPNCNENGLVKCSVCC